MRLRFLGTGTSYGVPYIGCDCEVCRSNDPRDKRLRASIVVEDTTENTTGDAPTRLLVDTGPDFRAQMLRAELNSVSAILWTHWHNDHIIGLDDIRPLTDRLGYVHGYANAQTLERLRNIFDYIFVEGRDHGGFPRVTPHVVEALQTLHFGAIRATPIPILHGKNAIFAWEFESAGRRIVYATDCSHIAPDSLERMRGCDIFIVDALRHTAHPNHFNIEQALEASALIGPGQTFFTHITHDLGHAQTEATLPAGVQIAFDGLELEV